MFNYLRHLAGRKCKTRQRSSRSRQSCLSVELLGERFLLSAGSSMPAFIDPMLPTRDGLVPVSSNYDDPFARPAHGERRTLESSEAGELKAYLPNGAVILTAEDLQAAEKSTLDTVFAATVNPGDGLSVSLSSGRSSVCASDSPSAISKSMLGSDSDFLAHRSCAEGGVQMVVMLGSKPGGAGDGILSLGLIDSLFSSDREVMITLD
jgi:hypothetical protein